MTEWRVLDGADNEFSDLFDVTLVDSARAFGNAGTAFFDDSSGDNFDKFPRGTFLKFQVKKRTENDSAYRTKLTGFVVERREKDRDGADVLEVEAYSVTALLQRAEVQTGLSGQSVTNALKQIIQDRTPVAWNASKVDVVDDATVTRSFLNERTDDVIKQLSQLSAGEEFYVDGSLEFVFGPSESGNVSRGIDDSYWTNYDIPEKAQETLNEVRIYYDGGDRSVTVDDAADKQDLQNQIGTTDPVSFTEAKTFEGIDNRQDAIAAGRSVLEDRKPTLTGTVTTFGLLDADPGDTIDIRIRERGINDVFKIAQIEYRWGTDETELTIVENKGNTDDILKRISDTLKRVEMRPAVADGNLKEDTQTVDIGGAGSADTGVRILTEVSGSIGSTGLKTTATVTNGGYNKIRDKYIGDGTLNITDIAVGTDGTPPSRSDTSLGSQSEKISATVNTPNNDEVEVTSSSFTTTADIQEVGIFTSDNTLVARGVTDTVSGPDSATLTTAFNDDTDTSQTVITNTGQTLLRDIMADNSPTHVNRYVFGDGTADVAESDSALGNELARVNVGDADIALADTDATWTDVTDISSDQVHEIDGGELLMHQTAYTTDAQDLFVSGSLPTFSNGDYTGGTGVNLDNLTQTASAFGDVWEYDSGDNIGIAVRGEIGSGDFQLSINGQSVDTGPLVDSTLNWTSTSPDIELNENTFFTINIEGGNSGTDKLDVITVFDESKHTVSNFDNANGGSSGYLDTPGNHPENAQSISLTGQDFQRSVASASIASTWDDTTGGQSMTVEGDTKNNTQSADFSFSSTDRFAISFSTDAYGSATGQTPLTRTTSQAIDSFRFTVGNSGKAVAGIGSWEVTATVEAGGALSGDTVKELGQLDSSGSLVTRTRTADKSIGSDTNLLVTEQVVIDAESRPEDTAFFSVTINDQNRS